MRVVYCAGPYRASNAWLIEQNIRHAEGWALEIWKAGAACLCPHSNTRYYQGAAPDHIWLDGDLEMLRRCDAVFMVPGWEKSAGSRAEYDEAIKLSIPVFGDFAVLCAWIQVNNEQDQTPSA
jgi:hypothetical protein